jgi:hypothetical protein
VEFTGKITSAYSILLVRFIGQKLARGSMNIDLEGIVGRYYESITEPFEPTHPGAVWASEVRNCARMIGFRLADVPRTEPFQFHSTFTFRMGNLIHLDVQKALELEYGDDVRFEVDWETGGISGRADVVTADEVMEIKSINAFSFKAAVYGSKHVPPAGPKPEPKLQALLSAFVLKKHRARVIFVTKGATLREPITIADWTYDLNPENVELVAEEMGRMRGIRDVVAAGELPKPVHDGKVIGNPTSHGYPCSYCGWQSVCQPTPRGRIKLTDVHGYGEVDASQDQI